MVQTIERTIVSLVAMDVEQVMYCFLQSSIFPFSGTPFRHFCTRYCELFWSEIFCNKAGQSYRVCVCNYMVGETISNTNICVAQAK